MTIAPLDGLDPRRFETPSLLRKLAAASRQLVELKGVAGTIPNQDILINTLGLREAKDGSAIENIVTTHDELFREDVFPGVANRAAAKEVQRYRQALRVGCWFLVTDYKGESFFVRHAYFLGQDDPCSALKTTLKAEINEEAWSTLNSDTSRPFPKPSTGRIAAKVINHLGDEVMKVCRT